MLRVKEYLVHNCSISVFNNTLHRVRDYEESLANKGLCIVKLPKCYNCEFFAALPCLATQIVWTPNLDICIMLVLDAHQLVNLIKQAFFVVELFWVFAKLRHQCFRLVLLIFALWATWRLLFYLIIWCRQGETLVSLRYWCVFRGNLFRDEHLLGNCLLFDLTSCLF